MKKLLMILTVVIGLCVDANAQAYRTINIESDASRYERELEIERRRQELERMRSGQTGGQQGGIQGNTIVNPNANVLQRSSYSDGKVFVYIENKSNSHRSNCRGERRADELIIENISNQTITVRYSFRHLLYNCDGYLEQEKTTYREVTLGAREKSNESGYLSNGRIGYYFVDSFSVMYVQY
jgi:hypothetical protein